MSPGMVFEPSWQSNEDDAPGGLGSTEKVAELDRYPYFKRIQGLCDFKYDRGKDITWAPWKAFRCLGRHFAARAPGLALPHQLMPLRFPHHHSPCTYFSLSGAANCRCVLALHGVTGRTELGRWRLEHSAIRTIVSGSQAIDGSTMIIHRYGSRAT
eukprot:5744457-Pleurochrysis_carterae.AAC.2